MYRNYIFDLYGTLVDIRTDEERETVWKKLSMFYGYYGAEYNPGELKVFYKRLIENRLGISENPAEYAGKSYEAYPEIRIEEIFSELFALKGVSADAGLGVYAGQFFRLLSTEYIGLYPGVPEFLRKLRQTGGKLYLLSNAQRIFTAYEMEYLKLTEYFDGIMISSDAGIKKPEKRFFEMLLQRYHLKPEESIMTGNDEICDIWGAQQTGMDTCYIHSNISPEYAGITEPDYKAMETDFEKVYRMIQAGEARDENSIGVEETICGT